MQSPNASIRAGGAKTNSLLDAPAAVAREREIPARMADLENACAELVDAMERLESRLMSAGVMCSWPGQTGSDEREPDLTGMGAKLRGCASHIRGTRLRLDDIILALEI